MPEASEVKPVSWVPNRKPTLGLVVTQALAVLTWSSEAYAHVTVPAEVALSLGGVLAFLVMYVFKEPR